jgi:hypothetical protein
VIEGCPSNPEDQTCLIFSFLIRFTYVKAKRILHIIFYGIGALLCLFAFAVALTRGHLFSNSSFGIPYLSLYVLVFLIPAILFIYQMIKYDKRSAIAIMILTSMAIIYLSYDHYQDVQLRIQMAAIRGPYTRNFCLDTIVQSWPFLSLLLGSILLYPRHKKN